MLRAKAGNTYLFGLDAEHVRRLTDGEPIMIQLGPLGGPSVQVVLFYGETLEDCKRMLDTTITPPPGH